MSESGAVRVAGFVDHHAHLLKTAAGIPYPWHGTTVREFHERVWRAGSTPTAEHRIRARGLTRAELAVEYTNPRAWALYERLGYVAYGSEPDGWDEEGPGAEARGSCANPGDVPLPGRWRQ